MSASYVIMLKLIILNLCELFINFCCMKPYNIKGTVMPTYAILAQVNILAQVKLNTSIDQNL